MISLLLALFLSASSFVNLKTPDLSEENLIGVHVGIRPCRHGGIRIEEEALGEKRVIHNYGYGGAGLTLSFGGAKEVLDLLKKHPTHSKRVAVLGAGVIGLTTAYELLEAGYLVSIYAERWSDLTSHVAGGIWSLPTDPEDDRLLPASKERFLKSIGDTPEFAGVHFMDRYRFDPPTTRGIKEWNWEPVSVHFDNGTIKEAYRTQDLTIDGKVFLADLLAKVHVKGALCIQRHFATQADLLALEEPILINCTSMGSKTLFHDEALYPIRGQLLSFKPQEGVDFCLHHVPSSSMANPRFFIHIHSWGDRMILGGVHEYGEEEARINCSVLRQILQNGRELLAN